MNRRTASPIVIVYCDTGIPAAATFQAHDTITFVARKLGFNAAAAKPYIGQVHVVDIGVPRKLLDEFIES